MEPCQLEDIKDKKIKVDISSDEMNTNYDEAEDLRTILSDIQNAEESGTLNLPNSNPIKEEYHVFVEPNPVKQEAHISKLGSPSNTPLKKVSLRDYKKKKESATNDHEVKVVQRRETEIATNIKSSNTGSPLLETELNINDSDKNNLKDKVISTHQLLQKVENCSQIDNNPEQEESPKDVHRPASAFSNIIDGSRGSSSLFNQEVDVIRRPRSAGFSPSDFSRALRPHHSRLSTTSLKSPFSDIDVRYPPTSGYYKTKLILENSLKVEIRKNSPISESKHKRRYFEDAQNGPKSDDMFVYNSAKSYKNSDSFYGDKESGRLFDSLHAKTGMISSTIRDVGSSSGHEDGRFKSANYEDVRHGRGYDDGRYLGSYEERRHMMPGVYQPEDIGRYGKSREFTDELRNSRRGGRYDGYISRVGPLPIRDIDRKYTKPIRQEPVIRSVPPLERLERNPCIEQRYGGNEMISGDYHRGSISDRRFELGGERRRYGSLDGYTTERKPEYDGGYSESRRDREHYHSRGVRGGGYRGRGRGRGGMS